MDLFSIIFLLHTFILSPSNPQQIIHNPRVIDKIIPKSKKIYNQICKLFTKSKTNPRKPWRCRPPGHTSPPGRRRGRFQRPASPPARSSGWEAARPCAASRPLPLPLGNQPRRPLPPPGLPSRWI